MWLIAKEMALTLCSLTVFSGAVSAQQFKAAPLPVQKSAFIREVKALRAANPKMTSQMLAEAASLLLDKHGIGFAISFDAATCERLKKLKDQQKDPAAPLNLGATLRSVDAEGATLALPAPSFTTPECGGCLIDLPLLQITDTDFIAVVAGRNIKFHLPANFYTDEAVLLDPKDRKTVKKKWRVPFRAVPIGVSHDENVLYLAFDEPELADLSLLIFGEGVFQVASRTEAEDGGKAKAEPPGIGPERFVKFDRWGNSYLVRYKPRCP